MFSLRFAGHRGLVLVTPWMAGIGMGASSLFVVLNALRVRAGARGERSAVREKASKILSTLVPRLSLLNFSMEILYLLIPLSVVLVFLIGWVFWWSLGSGQFDDLEGPAHRIFQDDEVTQKGKS